MLFNNSIFLKTNLNTENNISCKIVYIALFINAALLTRENLIHDFKSNP